MGICISRPPPPALCLAPGPGPKLVFTGAGPQFVFTGPDTKFVFTCPGPQFVFTGSDPQFVFTPNLYLPAQPGLSFYLLAVAYDLYAHRLHAKLIYPQ